MNENFHKNRLDHSTLDVDYKILAKGLAKRLQQVIARIISSDPTDYIKGRYISDNIRTMLSSPMAQCIMRRAPISSNAVAGSCSSECENDI